MASTPETGYLVIADPTGYTAYLSGSELEHAPAIAGDLLETTVGRLDPPFRLAKFEGAAARANGFALFTAQAVTALDLDSAALDLTESEESIEHLGRVSTFTLDLEARWQAESESRRLDVGEFDLILDLDVTVAAEPAVA